MRVLFLTGSGLSADSGLPTFRGAGGLYNGVPAEELLSAEGYARDAEGVESWLDRLRVAAANATPNAAHIAMAAYQARFPETALFTQNVDSLLERAGAREVVHLHGRLDRVRCRGHAHGFSLDEPPQLLPLVRCPQCGSRLRTDVVLFGELAPAYNTLQSALRRATQTDALVVIGTRGNVLPVGDFARAFPGLKILNNLHKSDSIDPALFDHVFEERAAESIDRIVELLEASRANAHRQLDA